MPLTPKLTDHKRDLEGQLMRAVREQAAKRVLRPYMLVLALLLEVGGFVWLAVVEWRIACALFIVTWGANLFRRFA